MASCSPCLLETTCSEELYMSADPHSLPVELSPSALRLVYHYRRCAKITSTSLTDDDPCTRHQSSAAETIEAVGWCALSHLDGLDSRRLCRSIPLMLASPLPSPLHFVEPRLEHILVGGERSRETV